MNYRIENEFRKVFIINNFLRKIPVQNNDVVDYAIHCPRFQSRVILLLPGPPFTQDYSLHN